MRISPGIQKGIKIGRWLFLKMINNLDIMGLPTEMWKFVKKNPVSEVVLSNGASEMQETVQEITDWTNLNKLQLIQQSVKNFFYIASARLCSTKCKQPIILWLWVQYNSLV